MARFRGWGWLKDRSTRRGEQPDLAEMGTAFGLDASLASIRVSAADDRAAGATAARPAVGATAAPRWWSRLGARLAGGR